VAKGYGIWLAKVVASHSLRTKDDGETSPSKKRSRPETNFRSIGDEEQTDRTFDHAIVDHIGEDFYEQVFAPAIKQAKDAGESYEDIRDTIRKAWESEK
jgi:hypothetical protein